MSRVARNQKIPGRNKFGQDILNLYGADIVTPQRSGGEAGAIGH